MPVVRAGELVRRAAAGGGGVLAFNAITLEHAEAIVLGAEAAGEPVILAVSQNAICFHGGLGPMAAACRVLAAEAAVDIGLHLDHIEQIGLVRQAATRGFTSVMFDASRLGHEANRSVTAEAAEVAHTSGLWLESELGEVGGKNGLHSPTARTDPAEAAAFVASTGVDALAVAVGTSHAMTEQVARVDLQLIAALREAAGVPLVLHGSSGLTDAMIVAAVRAGMVKINVGTQLNMAWSSAVADVLSGTSGPDPRPALAAARSAMAAVVTRLAAVVSAGPRSGCGDGNSDEERER